MKINNLIQWFKRMPIGNKITIMYAGVFSVVLIIFSIFLIFNAWYFYLDASKQELELTIKKVEEFIKSDGNISKENIEKLNTNKYIEVVVTNEKDLHRNQFEKLNDFPIPQIKIKFKKLDDFPPPQIKNDESIQNSSKFKTGTIIGTKYIYRQQIVTHKGERYIIQVFRPYYYEQNIIRIFGIIFITTNILGIFIAFMIGKFISHKLLKPVVDISKAAENISVNDLSQRINVPIADDELKTLVITFNDMITRLEVSFNRQKQFISDASHELRTPISVIQGYANLMDRWGKDDPEILQEAIISIKDETEHMSILIKKLLFLARDEQNKKNIQKHEICLNNIAKDVIKEVRVLDTNVNISFIEQSQVNMCGDFDLIKQMFWIFIENAIKYSNNNKKEISIKLYKENYKNHLSIKDNGIGISEEDVTFIFDRFYRSDKSRSKDIPGTGLGLSIASWIINQHNGTINVKSELGKGTEFIISFENKKAI